MQVTAGKWFGWVVLMSAWSLCALAGCSNGEGVDGAACETASDCASGQICDSGTCRQSSAQACQDDIECALGEFCRQGACAASACAEDSECGADAICDGATCRRGCRADTDCEEGFECDDTSLVCSEAGCLATGCLGFDVCDEDASAGPTCVPSGNCASNADCALYGSYLEDGQDYVCDINQQQCVVKPPCQADAECGVGEICEVVEGGRNICRVGCRTDNPARRCASSEFCDVEGTFSANGIKNVCIRGCSGQPGQIDETCNSIVNDPNGSYTCVDLKCVALCQNIDDCDIDGQVCKGSPRICQGCGSDDDCSGRQFCDKALGVSEEEEQDPAIGLCAALPPECPPDGYGDNDSLATAYEITDFPIVADGMMTLQQPQFCQENANGGEWFVFQADAGQVITATILYDEQGANFDLALKNSNGEDVITSARPPNIDGGEESISYGVSLTNTFYLQVRGLLSNDKARPYTLLVDVAEPPACQDDSLEENDTADTAVLIDAETLYENLQVCGSDRDFYRLDVGRNQVVTVETTAPIKNGNIDLTVTGPDGAVVAVAQTTMDNETLYFSSEEPGEYIVEVVVANGVGNLDYGLTWRQANNVCADDFDTGLGNDVCGNASPLALTPGTPSTFTDLNLCTDSDWYEISLLPLQQVTVTVTYDARQSAGFIDLRLRGPNDCSIIAAYDQRSRDANNANLVTQTVTYTAQNGGTFYLAATLAQGLNVNYDMTVDITEGPVCVDDFTEENDTLATAYELPATEIFAGTDNALLGLRFCDTDDDYYSLDLSAGDTVRWLVKHSTATGKDLDASIYLPDGTNPVSSTTTTDDEEVSFMANVAGTYTLRVYGKAPVRTDYRLLTYVTPAGSTTEIGPADPECPDIFENNDSRMEAVSVMPGTYNLLVCGLPAPTGDEDWFRTELQPGETITVTLNLDDSRGNIDLFLYDDSGSPTAIDFSQLRSDIEEVTFTADREMEVFYRVRTYTNVVSNTYEMTVAVTPAPACVEDEFDTGSASNDTGSTAATLTAPDLYSRLSKCEDNEDWYTFTISPNQRAEVYANFRADADIDLFVYTNAAGTNQLASGTSMGDGESVIFDAPSNGKVWVKVVTKTRARLNYDLLLYRDLNNNGTFDVGEGPEDRDCPDRFENNDTRTTARAIGSGTYEDLLLCWLGGLGNDEDYYSVFVPTGATVTVTLTHVAAQGDLQLELYEGNLIRANSRTANDTETVTYTNSGAGTNFTIRISGFGTRFTNYYDLGVGIAFSGTCAEDSISGNDRASAKTLTVGQYDNVALCENTEDWFKFSASSGQLVRAEFEINNRFGEIDVELRDSSDAVVASSATDGNRETISYTASSSGTYYLRVYSRNGTPIRNFYDLWLALGNSTPSASFCPDPYERNDERLGAAVLNYSAQKSYDDMIACGDDADWYAVSLPRWYLRGQDVLRPALWREPRHDHHR